MARRLLFLLPVLLFALIAGYFFWGLVSGRDPNFVPSAMINRPAPDIALEAVPTLDRPGFSTSDIAKGEITLINFFASWCLPCRAEHPLLTALAEEEAVDLIGVNYKDEPDDVRAWLEQLGNPYIRIGRDSGRGAIEWGVYAMPETFVIDGEGNIRLHHRGPISTKDLKESILPVIRALKQ